jgi:hypothetical protein
MRRGRFALIVLLVLVGAGVGGFFYAKSRVRAAIEKRCEAACQCTCEIDDLAVHGDGASARGVHLQAKMGFVTGDIAEIRARFRWWPMILGRPQAVAVTVTKPELQNDLPVGDFALQLQRMGDGKLPDGTPGKVSLERIVVEQGDLRMKVNLLSEVRVQAIEADWSPNGALDIRWKDASFDALLTSKGTGPCTIKLPKGSTKAAVVCGALKTQFDVTRVKSLVDLGKIFLKVDVTK